MLFSTEKLVTSPLQTAVERTHMRNLGNVEHRHQQRLRWDHGKQRDKERYCEIQQIPISGYPSQWIRFVLRLTLQTCSRSFRQS